MNMDYNIIVIGSRPFYNIDLNDILDSFLKNIRCNMSLPNNNNGTKIDEQFLNCHVFQYTMMDRKQLRNRYVEMFNEKYVKNFDLFDKTKWKKIHKQNNQDINEMNDWLTQMNIEIIDEKVLRVGFNSIWMLIKNKTKKIFVHGFSLTGDHKKKDMNVNFSNTSNAHNVLSEQRCLQKLHEKNILDATMCSLEDNEIPTFDCTHIKPKKEVLLLFLKKFGVITITNFFNDDIIEQLKNEVLRVFIDKKEKIKILNKEGCSNDERIFHIENESQFIQKIFSNNILFNEIASDYTKRRFNKKTLANKLVYEKGKIKNSGAGWHRDNHDMQFKCLIYLTDVTEKNGNFQFITNSSKKHIGYPPPRTPNYNTRFTDPTIEELLKKNTNCNLKNIEGKKGKIIIADTTYIHRGNIIQEGTRIALTEYFI